MTADVHTLTGAYAVDALPPDERAFFERHLAACEACRREVAELTATAATLGAGAADTPPPSLRSSVLAEVERTRQVPPQTGPAAGLRERAQPFLVPAAAAVLVFVAVLGAVSGVLLGRIGDLEQQVAANEQVMDALADPALRAVQADAPAGAVARLLHAPGEQRVVLVVEGLDPAPTDHAYQLWVLRDGTPLPDRVFQPDEHGRVLVTLEHDVAATDAVAATVEPDAGSQAPTGDIVISGGLDV
jgi:anti-sigma factor RsiW